MAASTISGSMSSSFRSAIIKASTNAAFVYVYLHGYSCAFWWIFCSRAASRDAIPIIHLSHTNSLLVGVIRTHINHNIRSSSWRRRQSYVAYLKSTFSVIYTHIVMFSLCFVCWDAVFILFFLLLYVFYNFIVNCTPESLQLCRLYAFSR